MLQNIPDPLGAYITNKYLKFFLYFIFLGVFIGISRDFGWHLIFGVVVAFFAFKKISDEKIKWGVITAITITILILGSLNQKNHEKPKDSHNQQNQAQKEEVQKPAETNTNQNITNSIENKNEDLFLVTRVIDGDTIEIEGGRRVRYIGIDTPETVDPNRPVGCYGKESSNKNSEMVLNKKVKLVKDVSDTDRYGRLLRYVYVDDTFVNDLLVKEGFAKAYTYPPDVKFSDQFLTSEREARENKKGLWSDACDVSTSIKAPSVGAPAPVIAPVTSNEPSKTETNFGGTSVSNSEIVKKSKTGICHAPGTTYYEKTRNFTPFDSVEACLNSGGRLPRR